MLPNSPSATNANSFAATVLINAKNVQVVDHLRNLYNHLLENHYIECIVGYDTGFLHIFSRDVLRRIKENDESWEQMVPSSIVASIKKRQLFGYISPAVVAAG
ncbi:MAG TPA: hypothetical protein VL069_03290 [Opitutus sp.]|nr:hypothetical protein [Opitutus sp.]